MVLIPLRPGGHLFAFYVQGATETTDTSFPVDGNESLEALRGVNGCPSRARRLRYTDDAWFQGSAGSRRGRGNMTIINL